MCSAPLGDDVWCDILFQAVTEARADQYAEAGGIDALHPLDLQFSARRRARALAARAQAAAVCKYWAHCMRRIGHRRLMRWMLHSRVSSLANRATDTLAARRAVLQPLRHMHALLERQSDSMLSAVWHAPHKVNSCSNPGQRDDRLHQVIAYMGGAGITTADAGALLYIFGIAIRTLVAGSAGLAASPPPAAHVRLQVVRECVLEQLHGPELRRLFYATRADLATWIAMDPMQAVLSAYHFGLEIQRADAVYAVALDPESFHNLHADLRQHRDVFATAAMRAPEILRAVPRAALLAQSARSFIESFVCTYGHIRRYARTVPAQLRRDAEFQREVLARCGAQSARARRVARGCGWYNHLLMHN